MSLIIVFGDSDELVSKSKIPILLTVAVSIFIIYTGTILTDSYKKKSFNLIKSGKCKQGIFYDIEKSKYKNTY